MTPPDLDSLAVSLSAHDRTVLIEIASHGIILPRPLLALVYTRLNMMSQAEIDSLCDKVVKAIEFIRARDLDGLRLYLEAEKIPQPLTNAIIGAINENGYKL